MGFVRKIGRQIDDAILQPITNTVEAIVSDPKKLAMVALSVMAPGVGTALGTAMGLTGTAATIVGQAAINAALNGGDVKSAIISAAIPVAGKEMAGLASSAFVDAGFDSALAKSAGSIVSGAGVAALTGGDPLQALISGGIGAGTSALTSQIDGFADLPKGVQAAVNRAIATTLQSGDPTDALVSSALKAGIGAIKESSSGLPSLEPAPADEPPALATEPSGLETLNAAPSVGDGGIGADVAASLTDYAPQDFGASANMDWASYEQSLKDAADNNGFSSLWVLNEDGTRSYTAEDGSTMTVDPDGGIVGVTNSTDTKYEPTSTPSASSPTDGLTGLLGSLGGVGALVGGAGALAAGAGIASGLSGGQDGGTNKSIYDPNTSLTMDWNQQAVNPVQNGIAYGQQYFNPTFQDDKAAAGGGLMALAAGGSTGGQYNLGSYSDGGRLLKGPGDGMSDNIPATIARKQPARLADGEFVIPADVVSHLGNGSTEAGSRVLYGVMDKVRRARTGSAKQGKKINPNKFFPR